MDENDIKYQFHDYKKEGANRDVLERFVEKFGWEKVLNRRGTTWRKLSPDEQNAVIDKNSAIALMLKNTSIIKRPLVDLSSDQLIGFDENEYVDVFNTTQSRV